MSTGAIVAIVILAVLVVILLAALPRIRARREERAIERERERAVDVHRTEAETRAARADHAERIAQKERAEAELHESRARLHEQGLADDELGRGVAPGTTADTTDTADPRFAREDARDVDADGHTADDVASGRTRRL